MRTCKRRWLALLLAAGSMAPTVLGATALRAAITIQQYPLPQGVVPGGIAAGPDGNLWFTADTNIGRISPAGSVTLFPLPAGLHTAQGIAAGPDGNLWFTVQGQTWTGQQGKVGRVTITGQMTLFDTAAFIDGGDITSGPDGNLWFCGDKIGRVTTGGSVTLFGLSCGSITTGPDGNLWISISYPGTDSIAKITPSGVATLVYSPYRVSAADIATGPDGALWFTDLAYSRIGRLTVDGQSTLYPTLSPVAAPRAITSAPDGNLWLTEAQGSRIVRLTTTGAMTDIYLGKGASPWMIAVGPDGNIWFSQVSSPPLIERLNLQDAEAAVCNPSPTTACITGRFRAEIAYETTQGGGREGLGNAVPLAPLGVQLGTLFWFFDPNNPEMLLKVLDACFLTGKYWVFASATTNVGFTLTVTDIVTGNVRVYRNTDGEAAVPIQDTRAFPCN